jgi:hypothetical protein
MTSRWTLPAVTVLLVCLGKQRYIFFKLHELKYLSYILFMVRNQLTRYTEALQDVITYINLALYFTYVEPPSSTVSGILYYQLFEELKSIVWIMLFFQNKLKLDCWKRVYSSPTMFSFPVPPLFNIKKNTAVYRLHSSFYCCHGTQDGNGFSTCTLSRHSSSR